MEEKKNTNPQKKLTYEELSKAAGELHQQYQKLVIEYQKAMEALNSRDFEYSSFFLQALFRVMDHPEMYKEEFTEWCSTRIEEALRGFYEESTKEPEKPAENAAE